MNSSGDLKEFGSDLTFPLNPQFRLLTSNKVAGKDYGQLYFSGRAALYSILEEGIKQLGWKRIYVPSYNCKDVYDFIEDLYIEIKFYNCNPLICEGVDTVEDKEGYVFLTLDYFGIKRWNIPNFKHTFVIEDLSLNLEAVADSKADVVFGSLRKLLPLPVGGFAKSNNSKLSISANSLTLEAEELAMQKMAGMFLKEKYLKGEFPEKELFRNLLIKAENKLALKYTNCILPDFVKALLDSLNIDEILERKRQNSHLIKSLLKPRKEFKLLTSDIDNEHACIMFFDNTSDRDKLRGYLIKNNIYPMVLWPNQFKNEDIDIQNKLLFVHVDYRHNKEDIRYIANIINGFEF